MARRVSLPSAEDLFRAGAGETEKPASVRVVPDQPPGADDGSARRPSGRVRHDEKMTVYVTADELLDIEAARLSLRRSLGTAVDRGRLVREAVALVLADLDEHGEDSALARRLSEG